MTLTIAMSIVDARLAAELRGRLGLVPRDVERWASLSPGERKRWQIGAALARAPDVLLLDEPTNHLDVDGRALLVGALRRFRGVGVVVSHDRALLDELPRATLRVHDARVTLHAGGYAEAAIAWEDERRAREEAHARAKARVIAPRPASPMRVESMPRPSAARSAGARMKDRNDHDARSVGRQALAGWAEARSGRTVQVVRAELARAERAVPAFTRDRTLGGRVFATTRAPRRRRSSTSTRTASTPPARPARRPASRILRDVRLTIGREERVRITGRTAPARRRSSPRSSARGRRASAFSISRRSSRRATSRISPASCVRSIPRAAVVSSPCSLRSGAIPNASCSGTPTAPPALPRRGPQARARDGARPARWALVLDEPTNHLDLPSIERLEAALESYPGLRLLVTHDDAFARASTSRVVRVERGTVM